MSKSLNDELCANLIHNLIVLRRQHGLSKKATSRLLGISLYSLNLLERGILPPQLGVDVIFRAQACFGISIRDLFWKKL